MKHKALFILCDNEHGTGDQIFPDPQDTHALVQHVINCPTLGELRKRAKEAGWSREGGVDYCPVCTESNRSDL